MRTSTALVALLLLAGCLAGCATLESRLARAEAIRAEADAVDAALDRTHARIDGIADAAERNAQMEEWDAARDALGVARSGAVAAAKMGDDGELSEIERVVRDLRRWADAFPTPRPPRNPSSDPGERRTPR